LFIAIGAPVNHNPYHCSRSKAKALIPQESPTSEQTVKISGEAKIPRNENI